MWIDVPERVHAFVKDADDVDDAIGAGAVEDYVNRLSDIVGRVASRVPYMETSNA